MRGSIRSATYRLVLGQSDSQRDRKPMDLQTATASSPLCARSRWQQMTSAGARELNAMSKIRMERTHMFSCAEQAERLIWRSEPRARRVGASLTKTDGSRRAVDCQWPDSESGAAARHQAPELAHPPSFPILLAISTCGP